MAPPSDAALEKALVAAVHAVLGGDDYASMSVNSVRKRVENDFGLEDGFFKNDDWKERSKLLIHSAHASAEQDEAAEPTPPVKSENQNGAKRSASADASPAPKRAKWDSERDRPPEKKVNKKAADADDDEDDDFDDVKPKRRASEATAKTKVDSDSSLSDLGSFEADAPKRKKLVARSKPKKVVDSEEENDDDEEEEEEEDDFVDSPPLAKRKKIFPKKPKARRNKADSDEEEEAPNDVKKHDESGDEADNKAKDEAEFDSKEVAEDPEKLDQPEAAADSDSELSSLIDEPPPKKKGKSKEPKGSRQARNSSKTKTVNKAPPKELTGDEAEMKKLEGQLRKCGVKTIFQFALKKYGDDTRAKIRHLKQLLSDIGMDGRFSDAKAREIKERRELMADVEEVQEWNENWGVAGRAGRASRSRGKVSLKEPSDNEEEGEEDDEGADAEEKKPRVSKRQADLAFLDDDDLESD